MRPANRASGLLPRRPAGSHPVRGRPRRPKSMTANPEKPALLPISATVICKNEEACIGECLGSLAGLAEIVVVDSGSTDRTLAIVQDFAARGFPIRLIHQD